VKPELYDHILTKSIEAQISQLGDPRLATLAPIDAEESHAVLAQYLERLIASSLALYRGTDAADKQQQLVERIIETLSEALSDHESIELSIATPLQRLLEKTGDCPRVFSSRSAARRRPSTSGNLNRPLSPKQAPFCVSWPSEPTKRLDRD
jgi:uncharacterized protein YoaH (UPF0181 family)